MLTVPCICMLVIRCYKIAVTNSYQQTTAINSTGKQLQLTLLKQLHHRLYAACAQELPSSQFTLNLFSKFQQGFTLAITITILMCHPHCVSTICNNKTICQYTTLYYNNLKSYMFRLYKTAIIRPHVKRKSYSWSYTFNMNIK